MAFPAPEGAVLIAPWENSLQLGSLMGRAAQRPPQRAAETRATVEDTPGLSARERQSLRGSPPPPTGTL